MEEKTYSAEEFIKTGVRRGYSRVGIAQLYVKQNPKEAYTEEDLIDLYRFADREPLRNEPIKASYTAEFEKEDIFDMWDRVIDCL